MRVCFWSWWRAGLFSTPRSQSTPVSTLWYSKASQGLLRLYPRVLASIVGQGINLAALRPHTQPRSLVGGLGGARLEPRTPVIRGQKSRQYRQTRVRRSLLVQRWICRFLAVLSGSAVYFSIIRNLQRNLKVSELLFLRLQSQRIFNLMPASLFQVRRLDRYPWRYGALALYLAVFTRDPALVISWLQDRIRVMTLRQHRRFLRTLALALRVAVYLPAERYALKGLRLYVAGKISVTGNAMSRVYQVKAGSQGNASLSLRHTQAFSIIRTRTGCLGLTLGFYF